MALDRMHRISDVLLLVGACALLVHIFHHPVEGKRDGYVTGTVSSLFPSSNCSSAPKGNHTLTVSHRYGPCSSNGSEVDYSKLVQHDIRRARALSLRLPKNRTRTGSSWEALPVGVEYLPPYIYVVSVGLGTPAQEEKLYFDTGSDLTWLQCLPCYPSCNYQPTPVFDPSESSSHLHVSCSDASCRLLGVNRGGCDAAADNCLFSSNYGNTQQQTAASGAMLRDVLTLTPSVAFSNFLFGCGRTASPEFAGIAGLMGLARSPISVPSQLSQWYGGGFSYCLPALSSQPGHLILGGYPSGTAFAFTQMLPGDYYYFVAFTGISVGGQMLPLSETDLATRGTIMDSGTTLTLLPDPAYTVLRDAFRSGMTSYRSSPSNIRGFDTCYDFTGLSTITYPPISLYFGGGLVVELELPGIFLAIDSSHFCFAFASNKSPEDLTIIGSTQQRTFEVLYDLANSRIGFGPGTCNA